MTAVLGSLFYPIAVCAEQATLFAAPELCGQVTALTVNANGQVFAARTARSFGRGCVDASSATRAAEDAQNLTTEDRRRMLTEWLKAGELTSDYQSAARYYTNPGDSERSLLTKHGERVLLFSDADGDGTAERVKEYAGGWNDAADGVAGGLVAHGSRIWFGCSPGLWAMVDDSGDGRCDRRIPALTGFSPRQKNGMTGGIGPVTLGPDGWIYFACGKRGCRVMPDGAPPIILDEEGGVFRCQGNSASPGVGTELLMRGLSEPVGIAALPTGQLLVAERVSPARTRILHCIPGMDARGRTLPPVVCGEFPFAVAGMITGPRGGTAEDTLYLADATPGQGGVCAVPISITATGIALGPVERLWSGGSVQALAAAADGTLYFADWGASFSAASECSIRKLPPPAAALAMWPRLLELAKRAPAECQAGRLAELLEHPVPLIRQAGGDAASAAGWLTHLPTVLQIAQQGSSPSVKLNALRILIDYTYKNPSLGTELFLILDNAEPSLAAAALHLLADPPQPSLYPNVLRSLQQGSPLVRAAAAQLLGAWQTPEAEAPLLAAIKSHVENPLVLNSCAFALSQCVDGRDIPPLAAPESPTVRRTALHAHLISSPESLPSFLPYPETQLTAALAIWEHPHWAALPALATALTTSHTGDTSDSPEFVKLVCAAALFLGTEEAAASLAAWLKRSGPPEASRLLALEALATWDTPPMLDNALRRHRPALARELGIARTYLDPILSGLSGPGTLGRRAANLLSAARQLSPALLAGRLLDATLPLPARLGALRHLATAHRATALPQIALLLSAPDTPEALRAAARRWQLKLEPGTIYEQIAAAMAFGTPSEKQAVLSHALKFDTKTGELFWKETITQLIDGQLHPAVTIEVEEALDLRNIKQPRTPWRRLWEKLHHRPREAPLPPAHEWLACRDYGDALEGERVAYLKANCMDCHTHRGMGGLGGPSLDDIGSKLSRTELLESIILPSISIEKEWRRYIALGENGLTPTGKLAGQEGGPLAILAPQGTFPLPHPHPHISPARSPMPSVSTLLTSREIRDLVAWLASLKIPPTP